MCSGEKQDSAKAMPAAAKSVRQRTITLPAGRKKRIHGIPHAYKQNADRNEARLPTQAVHYNGQVYAASKISVGGTRPMRLVEDHEAPVRFPAFVAPDYRDDLHETTAATYWETTGPVVITVGETWAEPRDVEAPVETI